MPSSQASGVIRVETVSERRSTPRAAGDPGSFGTEAPTLERREDFNRPFVEANAPDRIDVEHFLKLPAHEKIGRTNVRSPVFPELLLQSPRSIRRTVRLDDNYSVFVALHSAGHAFDLDCEPRHHGVPLQFARSGFLSTAPWNLTKPNALDRRMPTQDSKYARRNLALAPPGFAVRWSRSLGQY